MPELPEVETVRRVLETWIIGKKVAKVRVRYAPIFYNVDEAKVNEVLVGQTVEKIERYGKFLAFIYDKNVVVSHLRMEGKYHFGIEGKDFDLDSKEAKHMHVLFDYEDGTSLDCGIYSYFEVNNKQYFALLPLKGERELDYSQKYMLYEVGEDEENNPVVMYIEDDLEYAIAAQYFSNQLAKK